MPDLRADFLGPQNAGGIGGSSYRKAAPFAKGAAFASTQET